MLLTLFVFSDSLKTIRTEEVTMFHENDNQGATVLVSFLIGGIVGAGLALLFAPQTGRKTRRQIADLAEDVADSASGYAKKLKEKIA